MAQSSACVYVCAISYTPRSYAEDKKIGWRGGMRALYYILHYSAHCAPLPMQILLYDFICFCAALVNTVAFSVFLSLQIPFFTSIITAFIIAAAVNYFMCIAILFRHKSRWSTRGEVFAYLIRACIMSDVDLGVTADLNALGMNLLASKVAGIAVGFVGNFAVRKYLVFNSNAYEYIGNSWTLFFY